MTTKGKRDSEIADEPQPAARVIECVFDAEEIVQAIAERSLAAGIRLVILVAQKPIPRELPDGIPDEALVLEIIAHAHLHPLSK